MQETAEEAETQSHFSAETDTNTDWPCQLFSTLIPKLSKGLRSKKHHIRTYIYYTYYIIPPKRANCQVGFIVSLTNNSPHRLTRLLSAQCSAI